MITVQQADELLRSHLPQWGTERVPLARASGLILHQEVRADRDFPPFARVSMDGVAIPYAEWAEGRRTFKILGQIPAGAPPQPLRGEGTCWEVATGGMLPEGADTVVPYEQVDITKDQATIVAKEVRLGQNVHAKGKDRRAGEVLLMPGAIIGPAQMALLATVGCHEVRVSRRPSVAVIATGDELVGVEETPLPWQIRLSNPWAIEALLGPLARAVVRTHCADEMEALRSELLPAMAAHEVVIVTGGVSAGKRDAVPAVLREGGAEVLFHKVTQRPGKPFLFARTSQGGAVFALPGNPVSAFMCTVRYVLPWLRRTLGAREEPTPGAFLARALEFKPDLTWFVPVWVENHQGILWAYPQPGHGSGDLANLHRANAFLEMPRERDHFKAGETFPLWPYP